MDVEREHEGVDWIQLDKDRVELRTFVHTEKNILFSYKQRIP